MVVLKTPVVAGPAQAPQAAVIPLERVVNFLEANYLALASSQPGADIKASVVRLICVRK